MIEPRTEPVMLILLTRLIKDDRGVTAIEYGLIAALIAIGALVAINSTSLSLNLNTTFSWSPPACNNPKTLDLDGSYRTRLFRSPDP